MFIQTPFYIIAFAGLLHASFQLGVSLLTLLSGHSLGSKRSYRKLMQLNIAYVTGAGIITILLFAGLAYSLFILSPYDNRAFWYILSILNIVIGMMVVAFYYRKSKGTGLWIPRSMAKYMSERARKTSHTAEAFTLGAAGVLAEVPFIAGPLVVAAAYSLSYASTSLQIGGLIVYSLISLMPLLIIVSLIGAGHKISTIQHWREDNKLFLQYCAGAGLIMLGAFVFVDKVLSGGIL